jgi:hypothetical protein
MIFSKFNLKVVFLFLLLVIAFRFILIYQDEPDWIIRVEQLSNYKNFSYFFNYLSGESDNYFLYNCEILFEVQNFFLKYPYFCNQNFFVNIIRIFFTFLITLPILLLTLFKYKTSNLDFLKKNKYQDTNRILDAISITLVFPSTIYYLGLLSPETLLISISLLSIYFMRNIYLCIFIIPLLFLIDEGNAFVLTLSLFFFLFFNVISKNFGKKITIIFMVSLLIFFYIHSIDLIFKISDFFLSYDLDISFLNKKLYDYTYEYPGIIEKYPLFFRPIFSFMTLILFTPSGLKGFFSYIFVIVNLIFFLVKLIKDFSNNKNKHIYLYGVVPIFCILFFIFILPTYTNFKYYLFLVPFFFYYLLSYYSRNSLIRFSLITSLLVIMDIIIFRGI